MTGDKFVLGLTFRPSPRHARRYSRTREWWTGRTVVLPRHRRMGLVDAFERLTLAIRGDVARRGRR